MQFLKSLAVAAALGFVALASQPAAAAGPLDCGTQSAPPGVIRGSDGAGGCSDVQVTSHALNVSGTISASLAGFTPTAGATANVTDVVNVSQDVALPAGTDIIVTNKGSVDVNFRLQAGAGTAVATDQTLKAGAAIGIHITTATHLSVIAPTGTGTGATAGQVNIQGGTGLAAGYGGGSSSGGGSGTSVAQGSTTAGQNVSPMGCRTLTSAPTDTTAQTNMPWCTTKGSQVVAQPTAADLNATVTGTVAATQSGTWTVQPGNTANTTAWKVDGSAVTQPVSAASLPLPTGAATATNQTNVQGTVAAGTAATNSQLAGCVYNSTEPSPTTGQGLASQCDSKGRQRQVIMDAAGNTRGANVTAGNALTVDGSAVTQPVSAASLPLPTGAATSANQVTNAAQASTTSGQTGPLVQGAVTTAAPTYTTAQTDPLSLTTNGALRVLDNNSAALLTAAQSGTGNTGSAVPSTAIYSGANSGGNLTGIIQADTSTPINISTATTTQLVALVSGKKIYVTAWDVVAAGTGNITLEYGTGSNCGTGTTVLTGAYNLTAQSGIAKGNGLGPVLIIPASNALCALTSAAVQMSGSVAYTQF